MIVPDVNLLIYAMDEQAPQHDAAWSWWESSLRGLEHIGFGWSVLTGYVRMLTSPRTNVLNPGIEHLHVMERLMAPLGRAGPLVTDAHLVALAIENGGTVYSADADFGLFERVDWVNPLLLRQ
jgi:uncharacterized protein